MLCLTDPFWIAKIRPACQEVVLKLTCIIVTLGKIRFFSVNLRNENKISLNSGNFTSFFINRQVQSFLSCRSSKHSNSLIKGTDKINLYVNLYTYCDVNFQFTCDLTFIHGTSCSKFVSALLETQYLPTHSKIGNSIFFSITSIFTEASKL